MGLLDLTNEHKKIVVLGELGSGKSELSLNLAMMIRKERDEPVYFFDLDQTKPMFRSRESASMLLESGIIFREEKQFMDAPTVPAGVKESLADNSAWTFLDVGGSVHGACCLGQFAEAIGRADAIVLYAINPYRSFSDTTARIRDMLFMIMHYSGLKEMQVVSNPYLGEDTTAEDILEGHEELKNALNPWG